MNKVNKYMPTISQEFAPILNKYEKIGYKFRILPNGDGTSTVINVYNGDTLETVNDKDFNFDMLDKILQFYIYHKDTDPMVKQTFKLQYHSVYGVTYER